jgi:hypothetical protein
LTAGNCASAVNNPAGPQDNDLIAETVERAK